MKTAEASAKPPNIIKKMEVTRKKASISISKDSTKP